MPRQTQNKQYEPLLAFKQALSDTLQQLNQCQHQPFLTAFTKKHATIVSGLDTDLSFVNDPSLNSPRIRSQCLPEMEPKGRLARLMTSFKAQTPEKFTTTKQPWTITLWMNRLSHWLFPKREADAHWFEKRIQKKRAEITAYKSFHTSLKALRESYQAAKSAVPVPENEVASDYAAITNQLTQAVPMHPVPALRQVNGDGGNSYGSLFASKSRSVFGLVGQQVLASLSLKPREAQSFSNSAP